jgi:hypothetical protein
MAGVAEGPHGGSMGVSGPGTSGMEMGDSGSSAQKGYDYGFGGAASDTSTIEGFREAIARAMVGYVDQGVRDTAQTEHDAEEATAREAQREVERQALAQETKALREREAIAMGATLDQSPLGTQGIDVGSQVDSFTDYGKMDESQFDDPRDNSPVGAYSGGWADVQTETETSPTNTGAHPSHDPRIGLPMGVGRPAIDNEIENREPVDMYGRVAPIEDIEDPEHKAKAYEVLAKLQKEVKEAQTPLGKALRSIFGLAMNAVPGMGMLNMLGKAVKAGLGMLGMNVDPNIIGQAIRQAHEITTQGPLGAGGTSVGSRNDSFMEEFIRQLPASAYKEPWMKGLNEQQVQYYFDRPEELKWVRNLWAQMNPTKMESEWIYD